jgi:thioredoxin reductase (NADPH)
MRKPVILTVDDDPEVLQAIAQDLRRAYGDRFRVVRVESGTRALDVLRKVKLSDDPVALMLVDQRMPGLSGVDFLAQARSLYPTAKGALLTAYADTDAAIKAINDVHLDYYLMKPWDPPEDRLYPVLDDLLDDWLSSYRPAFEGIRVIGHRWSPESHATRDFLARNQVPYCWLDATTDPKARELIELAAPGGVALPVVIFPDGSVLTNPTTQALAEKIGMRGQTEVKLYDLLVVGAGPAGLAAAVYGASEGLRTAVLERLAPGGQAGMSSRIENYLGFPSGLSGSDLARRALTQAQRFGAELLLTRDVVGLKVCEGSITVQTSDGTEIGAHSLIVATGVSYRRLDVPGIEQLTGRGVYSGAAAVDAASLKGEDIYLVGGANSAGQAAIYFAERARTVTMLIRGGSLSATMSHYLVDRIEKTPNIHLRFHTTVEQAIGEEHLDALALKQTTTGEIGTVSADGLFIFIGALPRTEWLEGTVARDPQGFVLTGPDVLAQAKPGTWTQDRAPFILETSVPGIFAAGDVRHGSGKRVSAAVGEGSMAVMLVWQHRALTGL